MNSKAKAKNLKEIEMEDDLSIEEFFKQLEAKEKDLDISSDLIIEIDESDFNEPPLSEFYRKDSPSVEIETTAQAAHPPEEKPPAQIDDSKMQAEVSRLQNKVAQMETERAELFEATRRRQTDFENYKNRTERERGETFRAQISNLAMQMLPVVDNLNRALELSKKASNHKRQDFKQFFEGIVLVSQQLNEILAEMGVLPIQAVGETFDPHFHEAVATEPHDELPPNTVTKELLRGYQIGDRVIRPSMVRVSAKKDEGREKKDE